MASHPRPSSGALSDSSGFAAYSACRESIKSWHCATDSTFNAGPVEGASCDHLDRGLGWSFISNVPLTKASNGYRRARQPESPPSAIDRASCAAFSVIAAASARFHGILEVD